jgi:hypothetical protein
MSNEMETKLADAASVFKVKLQNNFSIFIIANNQKYFE